MNSTVSERMQRFGYKFVRLGKGFIGARGAAEKQYQNMIHEHAADGWRLVQIFAAGTGVYGGAKYYELVFERPVTEAAR